jgi:hypothetical protein
MPRCGLGEVMDRNCTNCRHFRPVEEGDQVLDYGECRAHPPSVVVVDEEPMSIYPQVDAEADCGEWKAQQ